MDTSADAYFPDPRPLPPGQRRQLWARLAIRLGIFCPWFSSSAWRAAPLLSLCMPFALALLATWLTEPLLRFFHRRWNIPRGIGAIVLILLLVGALGGLMAALIWKGWSELSTLWGNWDQGWNAFQETYYQLSHALDKWLAYLPQQVQDTLWNLSDRLLAWLEEFVYNLLPKTTSAVRSISSFVLAFLFPGGLVFYRRGLSQSPPGGPGDHSPECPAHRRTGPGRFFPPPLGAISRRRFWSPWG